MSWSSHDTVSSIPTVVPTGAQSVTVFVEPDSKKDVIVSAIRGAINSIWVEMYFLIDMDVTNELVAAARQGKNVQVMLDPKAYHTCPPDHDYSAMTQYLQAGGTQLQVQANSARVSGYAYKHVKMMIIDGLIATPQTAAYIMTANFDGAALGGNRYQTNREYIVCDTDPLDVAALVAVFQADQQGNALPTLNAPNLVISPVNSRNMFLALIGSAKTSIHATSEYLKDPDPGWGRVHGHSIEQALISAAKNNVEVQVILPSQDKADSSVAITTIQQSGAAVTVKTDAFYYMHAKVLIIDGQKALVGSQNLTTESLDGNREVGIVISNQAEVNKLIAAFGQDWQSTAASLGSNQSV